MKGILQNILIVLVLEGNHNFELNSSLNLGQGLEQDTVLIFSKETLEGAMTGFKYTQAGLNCFLLISVFINYLPLIRARYSNKVNADLLLDNQMFMVQTLYKIKVFFDELLQEKEIIFFVFYSLFAIMGIWNPLFTSFLLMDLFRQEQQLLDLLLAIQKPYKFLLLTIILLILMIYYESIIFYYNFYQSNSPLCNSLWLCFSINFDSIWKSDGGFVTTDFFQNDNSNPYLFYTDDAWRFNARVIYDFLYIFIILQLVSEIVSGKAPRTRPVFPLPREAPIGTHSPRRQLTSSHHHHHPWTGNRYHHRYVQGDQGGAGRKRPRRQDHLLHLRAQHPRHREEGGLQLPHQRDPQNRELPLLSDLPPGEGRHRLLWLRELRERQVRPEGCDLLPDRG